MKKITKLILVFLIILLGAYVYTHTLEEASVDLEAAIKLETAEHTSVAFETAQTHTKDKIAGVKPEDVLLNEVFIKLSNCIEDGRETVTFLNLTEEDKKFLSTNILELLETYNPYSGYISSCGFLETELGFMVGIYYRTSLFNTSTEVTKSTELANAFIANYISSEDSDLEKIKKAHDFIISNTDYFSSKNDKEAYSSHVPYGVLHHGKAVCEGYAKTLQLILNKLEIRNIAVEGMDKLTATTDPNVLHMWNKVYLDGNWYNVDPTWSDPVISNDTFTKIRKDISELILLKSAYKYFMISDEELAKDHEWDRDRYPAATDDTLAKRIKEEWLHEETQNRQYKLLSNYNILADYDSLKELVRGSINSRETHIYFSILDSSQFEESKIGKKINEGINSSSKHFKQYYLNSHDLYDNARMFELILK